MRFYGHIDKLTIFVWLIKINSYNIVLKLTLYFSGVEWGRSLLSPTNNSFDDH